MPKSTTSRPAPRISSSAQLRSKEKVRGIKNDIISVLTYFTHFAYPLSAQEIWYFLPHKASLEVVKACVTELSSGKRAHAGAHGGEYALRGYGINGDERADRASNTARILKLNGTFLICLSWIPWINLVGISGSCAMDNAQELDDLDVFIISAPGRIWLSRLTAITLAKLLGSHRSYGDVEKGHIKHKICLNLFFDGQHLSVPSERRSLYTAHEVVQMMPIVIRGGAYKAFIQSNSWVSKYFPNISFEEQIQRCGWRHHTHRIYICGDLHMRLPQWIGDCAEKCARWLQLRIMHARTHELVSDDQLWFFPHDYSDQLRTKIPL